MPVSARFGLEDLDTALDALLDQYPDAGVAATDSNGLYVPIPDSVPIRGHLRLVANAVLDLVDSADRVAMLSAWDRVRRTGAARASVHRRDGTPVTIHCLDQTERYGVYMVVFVDGGSDADPFQELLDDSTTPPRFCVVNRSDSGFITAIDEATTLMFGWAPDELVGHASIDFIHPDDMARAVENWIDMIKAPRSAHRWRGRHSRRDGSWIWLECTNHNRLDDPAHGDVLSEMVDISAEMAAQAAGQAREELLHRMAEALPHGVIQVDTDRQIIYTNNRLAEIMSGGGAPTVAELFSATIDEDRALLDAAIDGVLLDGSDQDIEVSMVVPDSDQLQVCKLTFRALRDEAAAVSGAVICVSDVTASTLMRVELEVRATYDPLTGTHNRASILSVLSATLARGRSAESGTAAIFIDLDAFKSVNDRLGHAAGDHLLAIIAERVKTAVRDDDVVGRIGGDEFLVVCPEIKSAAGAMNVARRICDRLKNTVYLNGQPVEQRASIGVAWTVNDGSEPETLVALADSAMYASKRNGAGRPVLASGPAKSAKTAETDLASIATTDPPATVGA